MDLTDQEGEWYPLLMLIILMLTILMLIILMLIILRDFEFSFDLDTFELNVFFVIVVLFVCLTVISDLCLS